MNHPSELEWHEGELPDVETAEGFYIAWVVHDITQEEYERCAKMSDFNQTPEMNGNLRRIVMAMPFGNDLNPLRWCDNSRHPIGYHEKVAHWAKLQSSEARVEERLIVDQEDWVRLPALGLGNN